ncbi:hypothetical protein JZO70_06970 [Enterococcus sp. 669A]|uniref:Uncharacterized protein n=1 Tax=Candidatus Enterococcus moelleringii TaxID=2815325 RepID=A0ABS3L8D5_9ENTE|nr:hypothetical protein [Enterococcus sp. 669A]MBO1305894.1 hypothetical protein [Enterococcus sp. 669A]
MMEIGRIIVEVIKNLGMRKIILIIFISVSFVYFLRQKFKRRRLYDEESIEEIYQKDENGLYPWEADTDDSPDRIPEDAKKYIHQAGPKRGRWS